MLPRYRINLFYYIFLFLFIILLFFYSLVVLRVINQFQTRRMLINAPQMKYRETCLTKMNKRIKDRRRMHSNNTMFALLVFCTSGFVLPTSSWESWELVWEDEFEKDTLQSEYWNIADNFTHGNRELQLYVKEQVSVRNGELILTTSK